MDNRQWLLFPRKVTKSLLWDIGMEVRTTPVTRLESNGMVEALVKTFKRDYVNVNTNLGTKSTIKSLHLWFEHYNDLQTHKCLVYRSPSEFIADQVKL